MIAPVEADEAWLVVDDGFDMDRSAPEFADVFEDGLSVIEPKIDPDVFVEEVELSSIAEVTVKDIDERPAVIGQLKEQPFLDVSELPAFDFILTRPLVVGEAEESMLPAKILGEECIDEVTSLWIRRTSKIFSRPRPSPWSQFFFAW